MPSAAIISGFLLILVGIIGYVYGMMGERASLTALIPAGFGLVLLILGFLSQSKENLRKHLMHVAVLVALLGFLIPTFRILSRLSDFTMNAANLSQLAMALICLVFVILSVKSFIDARRNRIA
jgi:hypothetical protein